MMIGESALLAWELVEVEANGVVAGGAKDVWFAVESGEALVERSGGYVKRRRRVGEEGDEEEGGEGVEERRRNRHAFLCGKNGEDDCGLRFMFACR